MRYVGGEAKEAGCVFCARLAEEDDVRSLILHRGERAFAIMNLYPYNTGHVMLVPNRHVASPEELAAAEAGELAALVGPTLRALRRALACQGFNLGTNVGAIAGAGVTDHVHQHVVPRWQGDANFMPILAATMVLPELIPVTYAKLRAEIGRELAGGGEVRCVVLDAAGDRLLAVDGRLPAATAEADEPLWRAAVRLVAGLVGGRPEIRGWAGAEQADAEAAPTLVLQLTEPGREPVAGAWVLLADALAGATGAEVAAALDHLGRQGTIRDDRSS